MGAKSSLGFRGLQTGDPFILERNMHHPVTAKIIIDSARFDYPGVTLSFSTPGGIITPLGHIDN